MTLHLKLQQFCICHFGARELIVGVLEGMFCQNYKCSKFVHPGPRLIKYRVYVTIVAFRNNHKRVCARQFPYPIKMRISLFFFVRVLCRRTLSPIIDAPVCGFQVFPCCTDRAPRGCWNFGSRKRVFHPHELGATLHERVHDSRAWLGSESSGGGQR